MDVDDLERSHRENQRLVGTYDEVGTRLQEFAELGFSRFYVGFESEDALDRRCLLSLVSAVAP
jgi:hypothetical protein